MHTVEAPPRRRPWPPAARVRRRRRPRLPRALWLCMALAAVNAVTWSALTPPFQVPDEEVHSGYAQYLAETARIPRVVGSNFYWSPPPDAALAFTGTPFSVLGDPSWSAARDARVQRLLATHPPSKREGGAGYAANNAPLYYAFEAIPYRIAASGTFLDRLWAMRLGSALLAAITVGFVYLFLRELLPERRWAWTVGALAVAFQPLFAFIAGGVNNDNLVWTWSTALLFLLARSFRHGLTVRRGVAIGAVMAAGILTKTTMLGLLPGALLALALLVWRTPRGMRRPAATGALAALATGALPVAAWLIVAAAVLHRATASTTAGFHAGGATFQWRQLASYVWQFYLPRLPGMRPEFPYPQLGYPLYPTYPLWQTYVQGLVGRFGWFQYGFPAWVNWLALGVYLPLLALAGTALFRARDAVRRRWPELLAYAVLLGGLMLAVNAAGYEYRLEHRDNFEQTRYLFPLIGLYAAVVACAAIGAGRRLAPAAGALLVVLAVGHNAFAQVLTVSRYYDAPTQPAIAHGQPVPATGPVEPRAVLRAEVPPQRRLTVSHPRR